jgi:predicted RNA polymerase sigma factor
MLDAVRPHSVGKAVKLSAIGTGENTEYAEHSPMSADDLPGYHLLPATRADLLTRLGRTADAVAAYDETIALATNDTERTFLQTRRARLTPDT